MLYDYRVLLDVDEVLADFQTPALKVMHQVTGHPWAAEDIDDWDVFSVLNPEQLAETFQVVKAAGFCSSLQPLPGAVEAVREMRSMFSDVHLVTSPFYGSPTWVQERTEWIADIFGLTDEDVTHTRAKWGVYGDALYDDKPVMHQKWVECHPGGLPLLRHLPNTRNIVTGPKVVRVYSYTEAIRHMKNHAERRQGSCTRCERDK